MEVSLVCLMIWSVGLSQKRGGNSLYLWKGVQELSVMRFCQSIRHWWWPMVFYVLIWSAPLTACPFSHSQCIPLFVVRNTFRAWMIGWYHISLSATPPLTWSPSLTLMNSLQMMSVICYISMMYDLAKAMMSVIYNVSYDVMTPYLGIVNHMNPIVPFLSSKVEIPDSTSSQRLAMHRDLV